MRKLVVTTLIFAFCLTAFIGCNQSDNATTQFDFSYSIEKTEYARGETVLITAEITNVSGKTYRYNGVSGHDFYPAISLYQMIDGQQYEIPFEPYAVPAEAATKNKKIKDGESGSWIYKFIIPEEAPVGDYSITLSKDDFKKEFANIFSVIETQKEVSDEIILGWLNHEVSIKSELILDLLNNGMWVNDTADCDADYRITLNEKHFVYHSACGTFNNITDGTSLTLADDDKVLINNCLNKLFEGFNTNEE